MSRNRRQICDIISLYLVYLHTEWLFKIEMFTQQEEMSMTCVRPVTERCVSALQVRIVKHFIGPGNLKKIWSVCGHYGIQDSVKNEYVYV